MVSARRCIGALEPCACSTRRTIRARVVAADFGGAEDEAARLVESRADDGVAAGSSSGRLSPVSMLLVERRATLGHHAIDRHFSPRELRTGSPNNTSSCDVLLDAIAEHAGGLGLETH